MWNTIKLILMRIILKSCYKDKNRKCMENVENINKKKNKINKINKIKHFKDIRLFIIKKIRSIQIIQQILNFTKQSWKELKIN